MNYPEAIEAATKCWEDAEYFDEVEMASIITRAMQEREKRYRELLKKLRAALGGPAAASPRAKRRLTEQIESLLAEGQQ